MVLEGMIMVFLFLLLCVSMCHTYCFRWFFFFFICMLRLLFVCCQLNNYHSFFFFFFIYSNVPKNIYNYWSLVESEIECSRLIVWTMNYEKICTHANKAIICSINMINEWTRSFLTYFFFSFLIEHTQNYTYDKFYNPIIFLSWRKTKLRRLNEYVKPLNI